MPPMSPPPKSPAKFPAKTPAKTAAKLRDQSTATSLEKRAGKAVEKAAEIPARKSASPTAAPGGEFGPLSESELDTLQALMDSLPATLEPLDTVMIDGYLCGVLLQPQAVPEAHWLAHIADVDGRAPPTRFDAALLRSLVLRRYSELNRAIAQRQWFDPWVYQLDDEATPSETVLPWVAGFATAVDLFTTLMDRHEPDLLEPLATLYRHLDPDDLEDAEELLAEIETLAPPETLVEAVEDLVRSVLLMADVSRPVPTGRAAPPHPAVKRRASQPAGRQRAGR